MTRRGKIARLPLDVREELNRRLHNGEMGTRLLVWLNGQPEVRRVLAADFGQRNINGPNLTEWKSGGYQDWLAEEAALAQAKEWTAVAKEWASSTEDRYTDHLTTLVAARYAAPLANWDENQIGEFRRKQRALRPIMDDILKLRREDLNGIRLVLEQEQQKFNEAELAQAVKLQELKSIKVS